MTATKWQPTDDELDGVARTLTVPELHTSDAEQQRVSLLASAAGVRQLTRRSRAPAFVALGVGVAAAAAVLLWIALPHSGHAPRTRAEVAAIGTASYVHEQGWPSYRVRVGHGRVAIQVATSDTRERFVAASEDGEVATRFANFVVAADSGRLTDVAVQTGFVELRYSGATIILAAGQSWTPKVRTAELTRVDLAVQPSPASPASPPSVSTSSGSPADEDVESSASSGAPPIRAAPTRTRRPTRTGNDTRSDVPAQVSTSEPPPLQSPPTAVAAKPGELEFRAGVAALRAGDATGATKSFTAACAAARGDALGEDACFWVGAAANRAGQISVARDALVQFIAKFPASARAREASALLGWLLYNAGDLDGAESRFTSAATDRVPKVRESAERGLEAIKRKRGAKL